MKLYPLTPSIRYAACVLLAAALAMPCASAARKSKGDAKSELLKDGTRGAAKQYERILQSIEKKITPALPKLDEETVKLYTKAAQDAATANAAVDAAYKASTAKEVADRKGAEAAYKNAKGKAEKAAESLQQAASSARTEVDAFLSSDKFDEDLIIGGIIGVAKPENMAVTWRLSKESADSLVRDMLADKELARQVALADGAAFGRIGVAMQIYHAILKASPQAKEGPLQRLALGTALQHADPVAQSNPETAKGAPAFGDPVKRYLHYEKAYLAGELDPDFPKMTVWEYRHTTNSYAPDEALAWGREMLRNYRPDHIAQFGGWKYTRIVKTDVRYGSQHVDKDKPELFSFQNILCNGGVCGRRAFFGRFICRSFGNPVYGVTQKAHAAVGRWTPDGWLVNLGAGFEWSWWDKGDTPMSGTQFLTDAQARAVPAEYMKVLRARWISHILGEEQFNDRKNIAGGFWSSMSYQIARDIAAKAKDLGPVGEELAEANVEEAEVVQLTPPGMNRTDRRVRSSQDGTIMVPAVAVWDSSGTAEIIASYGGGGQLHIGGDYKKDQTVRYVVESEKGGQYLLVARVCTVHTEQTLMVTTSASTSPVEMPLPYTIGKWEITKPITVTLKPGENNIILSRPPGHGITIKEFALQPK